MNYFTIKSSIFLVPSNKCDEEFRKIDKFLKILNISGIGVIIEKEKNKDCIFQKGRKGYNPYNLMATVLYCFSNFKSSLREIEKLCIFDIRVIYLMEQQTPDHSIFGDFINRYIVPYQYEIFTMITKAIINELNIDVSNQYLDGTKIEANANKYKFVWKPTTYHQKLDVKVKQYLLELGYTELSNKK